MKIVNLFVLDKSGSMSIIREKIISGFNEQIQDIKKLDKQMDVKSSFGLMVFDSQVVVKYLDQPVEVAEELNAVNYRPDGGTAFYDAIVDSIKALENSLGSSLTDCKVLVTYLTDGEDTSSSRFEPSQAADLIKQFQDDYQWTFSFIGANINVEELARKLNVPTSNTLNFVATAEGTQFANSSLISARSAYYTRSLNGEDTSKSFFHAEQQK